MSELAAVHPLKQTSYTRTRANFACDVAFLNVFTLACRREQTQAKHFKDIWGFLVQTGPPTSVSSTSLFWPHLGSAVDQSFLLQLTRPHAVKTVKYINPAGGTWTVAAQRIPAQSKVDMEMDAVSSIAAT